jgi:pyridoxine 5'-phosphate synthase PdxJ
MERPRANKRHVTPKHIPQLGKFVQTPSSQECAKTGETLMIGEGAPVTGVPFSHRSELVEREELPI